MRDAQDAFQRFAVAERDLDALVAPVEARDRQHREKQERLNARQHQREGAAGRRFRAQIEIGERLVPDDEGTRVDIAVDRHKLAFCVSLAGVRERMVQFVFLHPPGRAEALCDLGEQEHELRILSLARSPLLMGDVVRQIGCAGIMHAENNRAERRSEAALRQQSESDRRHQEQFDDAKSLLPERNDEISLVFCFGLESRHAPRQRFCIPTMRVTVGTFLKG